jgi:thiol:disulfide interchange protein DsbD
LAAACAVALLAFGYFAILEGQLQWRRPVGAAKTGIDWQPWSAEAVEAARREGHPALVDFTAKSCLSCQVNKARSIEIAATRAKLKEIGAVAFEADYTDENPVIGRELHKFERDGVPLVLVYSKDVSKPPEVLPTLLSPAIVLNALNQAAN